MNALGLEAINPNTIGNMQANVQLHVSGTFSGNVSSQDSMEIKVLTFQNYPGQIIQSVTEKLVIGNETYTPTHETIHDNTYAVFKLTNLLRYSQNPRFDIYLNAHVKTTSQFALKQDYNLSNPILEQTEFQKPTDYIESNDPTLIAKTNLEFQSESELETIAQITQWVHENTTYDLEKYYNAVYSARQTYDNKAGVCDEFANLTAAFLRIKGIPTRYVAGISFDGSRFGNHGWAEAYLPQTGWIGVDSTYAEAGYTDAMHIALGKTTDTNQLKNVLITTTSIHPLQIQTVLQDPYVELDSLEYRALSNLTSVTVPPIPTKGLNQPVDIVLEITNRTPTYLIVPVDLQLHPDFFPARQSAQVVLLPNETKTVSFQAKTPPSGKSGFYATYGARIMLSDQNIETSIEIHPDQKPTVIQKPSLQIQDIRPTLDQNTLSLQITLQNPAEQNQTIDLQLTQENNRSTKEETIPANSNAVIQLQLAPVHPGTVQLSIRKDYNYSAAIQITSDPQPIVNITPLNSNTTQNQSTQGPFMPSTDSENDPIGNLIRRIIAFFTELFASLN